MQQTHCNTHNKARIPATISQQVYDYCITTSLQQVHNRMILYGNQALISFRNHHHLYFLTGLFDCFIQWRQGKQHILLYHPYPFILVEFSTAATTHSKFQHQQQHEALLKLYRLMTFQQSLTMTEKILLDMNMWRK